MYEQYFAFKRPPFSIAPDPSFLYPSPQHRDGLEHLLYGLNKEGGFIILTGEVGTGKTTLCRLFLRELPQTVSVATVLNAKLDTNDLLSSICNELGAALDDSATASPYQKTQAISATLYRNHEAGLKTLLIIEEAQNLNPDALETLRLLTNIETDTTKLLHILLIGQPELVATLNRPDLRQLAQRIIARFHLQPLSLEQTQSYITHRLTIAGGQVDVFKRAAVKALYEESNGIPRLINLIADRTLLTIYNVKSKYATTAQVKQASTLIKTGGSSPTSNNANTAPRLALIASVSLFAVLALGVLLLAYPINNSGKPVAASQNVSTPAQINNQTTVAAQPIAATAIDINQQLLELWHIGASSLPLCDAAAINGFQCLQLQAQTIDDLVSINRPALVTVFNRDGIATLMLLRVIADQTAALTDANGNLNLPLSEFTSRWRGDITTLWQAPPGFVEALSIGDKSYQTVFWLQDALNQLNVTDGKIITGGIYNMVLADKVKTVQRNSGLATDGVLGKRTIMAINAQLNTVPLLITAKPVHN